MARGRLRSSPSASARRHLDLSPATAGAAGVAVLGLSLSTAGNPKLGFFLFLAAALLLGLDAVIAVVLTRGAVLEADVARTDLVVGDHFQIALRLGGYSLPFVLRVRHPEGVLQLAAEPPAAGPVEGVASARGVVSHLEVDVESTGLCGLVGCVRAHTVALRRPLEIGPRPVAAEPLPEVGGGWGEGAAVPAPVGDIVRGVRAYLPGDHLRQVHWRATAHHGELVVKESEEPQSPLLHLVLDLGEGGPAGEEAAGRAAWYASDALRRGYRLVLTTTEADRTVTAPAPTPLVVNRRLARAVRGRPPLPARARRDGPVLLVRDEGDTWP